MFPRKVFLDADPEPRLICTGKPRAGRGGGYAVGRRWAGQTPARSAEETQPVVARPVGALLLVPPKVRVTAELGLTPDPLSASQGQWGDEIQKERWQKTQEPRKMEKAPCAGLVLFAERCIQMTVGQSEPGLGETSGACVCRMTESGARWAFTG